MCEALVLFMQENINKVKEISQNFLKRKGISFNDYFQNISTSGNSGNELALHLLCIMQGIHYCIITKTQSHYSHPTTFPSPSAVHKTLVYLRNKVFWDTTKKAMKSPPPPHIEFNEPLPSQISA